MCYQVCDVENIARHAAVSSTAPHHAEVPPDERAEVLDEGSAPLDAAFEAYGMQGPPLELRNNAVKELWAGFSQLVFDMLDHARASGDGPLSALPVDKQQASEQAFTAKVKASVAQALAMLHVRSAGGAEEPAAAADGKGKKKRRRRKGDDANSSFTTMKLICAACDRPLEDADSVATDEVLAERRAGAPVLFPLPAGVHVGQGSYGSVHVHPRPGGLSTSIGVPHHHQSMQNGFDAVVVPGKAPFVLRGGFRMKKQPVASGGESMLHGGGISPSLSLGPSMSTYSQGMLHEPSGGYSPFSSRADASSAHPNQETKRPTSGEAPGAPGGRRGRAGSAGRRARDGSRSPEPARPATAPGHHPARIRARAGSGPGSAGSKLPQVMAVHGDGKKGKKKKGKKGKGDDGQGDLAQPWSVQSVEELGLGKTVAFSDEPPAVVAGDNVLEVQPVAVPRNT